VRLKEDVEHRPETEDRQLEALRHQVKLGLDALGQGAFADVDDADVDDAARIR
jgi:hypothetical protein